MEYRAASIGDVKNLYRFPVKSLLGEECETSAITQRGLAYDRQFAITNSEGKFGSHKSTRRFAKMKGLFKMRSFLRTNEVWISFPDGAEIPVSDPSINEKIARVVGHPVTLEREEDVSHFDAGPIHIVSTASLSWLQSRLPASQIDPLRFRANLVIACDGDEQVEDTWLGKKLFVGTTEFEINARTERCLMTTLAQGDLPRDPTILTEIGRKSELNFGVYAKVIRSGTASVGDTVYMSD